jgi:hypothetical protein
MTSHFSTILCHERGGCGALLFVELASGGRGGGWLCNVLVVLQSIGDLALSFENTVTFMNRFLRYINFYACSTFWSYATWLQLTCNLMRASMELTMKTVPLTSCLNLMEGWMVWRQKTARVARMGCSHRSKRIMGTLSLPSVNGEGGEVINVVDQKMWRIFHCYQTRACRLLPLQQ